MSIRVMTDVWQHSRAKGGTLLLLLAIADAANDEGVAWPKQATLSRKTRLSRRAVQYCQERLEELGELTVRTPPGKSSTYQVNLRNLCAGDPRKDCASDAKTLRTHREPSENRQDLSKAVPGSRDEGTALDDLLREVSDSLGEP